MRQGPRRAQGAKALPQQGGDKQDGAPGDDAGGRCFDVSGEVLRQRTAEHPGNDPGNDPGAQRQCFFYEAALQADQSGDGDNCNDRPVNPGKWHSSAYGQIRRRILAERRRSGKAIYPCLCNQIEPFYAVSHVQAGSAPQNP